MPPQAVIDALGDSIDAEELKGDYAAAAAAAAGALEAARAGADPAARADAAIWAGIVAALRSEPAAAVGHLEEALAAVPDHALGVALRHLATAAAHTLPDGHGRDTEPSDLWTEPSLFPKISRATFSGSRPRVFSPSVTTSRYFRNTPAR